MRPALSIACFAASVVAAGVSVALAIHGDILGLLAAWFLSSLLFVCGLCAVNLPLDPRAERDRLKAAYFRALARNDRRGAGEVAKRFRAATNDCLRVGK